MNMIKRNNVISQKLGFYNFWQIANIVFFSKLNLVFNIYVMVGHKVLFSAFGEGKFSFLLGFSFVDTDNSQDIRERKGTIFIPL